MDDQFSDIQLGADDANRLAAMHRSQQMMTINDGLEGDPDKAAEAVGMSEITGDPATGIMIDPDEYKANLRKATAQAIVLNNPDLVTYMQSHPLASTISSDDWGNLDKFTRESSAKAFQGLQPKLVTDAADQALQGAIEGAKEGWQGAGSLWDDARVQAAQDPRQNVLGALGAAASTAVYGLSDLVYRTMAAGVGATEGAAGGVGEAIGGPRLGREFKGIVESEMNRGMAEAGLHSRAMEPIAPKPQTAADLARPFAEAGEEPPTGLHPDIDKAKAQVNATYVEAISKDLENAAASTTRERSGELFQQLTRKMYGDSEIGIHPEAVINLYGDKAPSVDDGLLGWVPRIGEQLQAAKDTGDDIQIPMADWMAKVDPTLAKGLRDDIRVWPGGVTAREAAELPTEPKGIVDEALPTVRASAGLEPKFSMGDRKLTLLQKGIEAGDQFHPEAHTYDILDENQQPVGNLSILPGTDGKTLYVDWIGGQAGLWSNSFGPALVRDLKRQLKAQYPDYEYLTGHRVTGGRFGPAMAGEETPMPLPRVRLAADGADIAEDHQRFLDVLQNGFIQHSENLAAAAGQLSPAEQAVASAVETSLRKMGGEGFGIHPTKEIELRGQPLANVRGAYIQNEGELPKILYNLRNPEVGFHELLHHLRASGMLTDDEWGAIAKGAQDEDWAGKYNIADKYGHLDADGQLEEAAAHHMEQWIQRPEELPKTGWGKAFAKVIGFLNSIKEALGFGAKDTWESVFKRIESGDVAQRQGASSSVERLSVGDDKAIVEGLTNLQAASIGMDTPTFKKIQEAVRKRADEDLAKHQALAEKEQRKRQTAEWKSNAAAMRQEVAKAINNRPDVAADAFLARGEFFGEKLRGSFSLREDALTPEQRATLPERYVSKSGLDPDHVAGLFGFSSGEEMVNAIGGFNKLKIDPAGNPMRTGDFVRKLINDETERRMEAAHGNLAGNILDAAKDQALSESSLNVMHEELYAAAQRIGTTVMDREVVRQAADKIVGETPIGQINSQRMYEKMGMHARRAEKAQANNDWAEALGHMQKQTLAAEVAKRFKEVETEVAKFNRDAKRWGKFKQGSIDSDYVNVIQKALSQIGKSVNPSDAYLTREMGESGWGKDLQSFVSEKMAQGNIIDPWEALYDPKYQREFKDLTSDEFNRADSFIRSLVKAGRDEKTVYKEQQAHHFQEDVKPKLIDGLDRLRSVSNHLPAKVGRTVNSLLIQMETYIDRLDQWNPNGAWNDFFLRPLFDSEHVEMDRAREVTKEIQQVVGTRFDNKEIMSIFTNPRNGKQIVATRKTLWAAMLNQGNVENQLAFAKSWGLKPEVVKAWIDAHASPEDWHGVQAIWDIFKKTGEWSDDEYRRLSGRAMKFIEPQVVDTPHGQFPGGYYPIMHHPEFPGKSKNLLGLSEKGLFGDGFSTGFVPGAGYRIDRTGYIAPMALDLNQVPGRLMEQIHDGAMRGAVLQAAKILRDPDIKDAIIEKLGQEVYDGFIKHVRRIGNRASLSSDMSLAMQRVMMAGDYIRRNVISNMIGLNMGTVEKHGPTAFVTSVSQLGLPKMLDAYRDIWLGDELSGMRVRKSIYEKSALMRGRQRYWQDSLYGSVDNIHSNNTMIEKFLRFREWSQWAATQPVAMSDALSAEPLWWGTYKDSIKSGASEGDAVALADKSVRKAHGSGGVVGQPLVVNEVSKWFTPMYNFYNSVLNKAVESYWRAGEAAGAFKEGDYAKMQEHMKKAAVGGFVALVVPAVIHDLVSPPKTGPDDSWEFRMFKYIAGPMAAFIPTGANTVEYITGSSTPDVGLQTAAMKQAGDFIRDLTLNHKHQTSAAANEKLIRDGGSFLGWLGVGAGRQLGVWASGAYGLETGREHPRSLLDAASMVRFGTVKKEKP